MRMLSIEVVVEAALKYRAATEHRDANLDDWAAIAAQDHAYDVLTDAIDDNYEARHFDSSPPRA